MKILCFDIDSSSIAYDLSTRQVTMNAETNSAKDATDFSAKVRAGEYSDRQSYNRIMVLDPDVRLDMPELPFEMQL